MDSLAIRAMKSFLKCQGQVDRAYHLTSRKSVIYYMLNCEDVRETEGFGSGDGKIDWGKRIERVA